MKVGEITLTYEIRGLEVPEEDDTVLSFLALCAQLAQDHPPELVRRDFPNGMVFGRIHTTVVYTLDSSYCGLGSATLGSVKVWWRPYCLPAQGTRCDPHRVPLAMDNLYALAHEFHHALGGPHLDYLLVPFYVLRTVYVGHHQAWGQFLNPRHYEEWIWEVQRWQLRKRAHKEIKTLLKTVSPVPPQYLKLLV
ncbi:MAG: hypothetical protein QXD60_00955 [Nanopusillaceae archaeon]